MIKYCRAAVLNLLSETHGPLGQLCLGSRTTKAVESQFTQQNFRTICFSQLQNPLKIVITEMKRNRMISFFFFLHISPLKSDIITSGLVCGPSGTWLRWSADHRLGTAAAVMAYTISSRADAVDAALKIFIG